MSHVPVNEEYYEDYGTGVQYGEEYSTEVQHGENGAATAPLPSPTLIPRNMAILKHLLSKLKNIEIIQSSDQEER